jgi:hypothetical protein
MIMRLDEAQRKKVVEWIAEGLKLSEIQNKLASEFHLRVTYMDVRMIVDDLKLTPKDPEPPKVVTPPPAAVLPEPVAQPENKTPGDLLVTVDKIPQPGSMVSGKVTFPDGHLADWYLDQNGRLGLAPKVAGYRPSAADVQKFQVALEAEISKAGI